MYLGTSANLHAAKGYYYSRNRSKPFLGHLVVESFGS